MFRRIAQFLMHRQPASFSVAGSMDEAVARLAAEVKAPGLPSAFSECVMGDVAANRVILGRYRFVLTSPFAPVFRGQFASSNGDAVLAGAFSLHWSAKLFLCLWLVFSGSLGTLALVGITAMMLKDGQPIWLALAYGTFMSSLAAVFALLGWSLAWLGSRFSQGDIAYISAVIQKCLDPSSAEPVAPEGRLPDGRADA